MIAQDNAAEHPPEVLSDQPSIYPKGSTAADIKAAFDQAKNIDSEIPSDWSEEDKNTFHNLDAKTKSWLVQRHKAMEGDYTRKTMGLSTERKKLDQLQKIFSEYQSDFQAAGVDETQAVARLLDTYRNLKTNPKATLAEIADSLGVSINDASSRRPARDDSGVKDEIQKIKQVLQQQHLQHAQISARIGQQKINELVAAKDVAGKLQHPHFETLLPQMLMLAHADLVEGKQPDLKDLYDRASWSHPKIREELISAQLTAAERNKQEQSKAKVEAARKAGVSIYGTPHTDQSARKPAKSLREELEAAFRDSIQG